MFQTCDAIDLHWINCKPLINDDDMHKITSWYVYLRFEKSQNLLYNCGLSHSRNYIMHTCCVGWRVFVSDLYSNWLMCGDRFCWNVNWCAFNWAGFGLHWSFITMNKNVFAKHFSLSQNYTAPILIALDVHFKIQSFSAAAGCSVHSDWKLNQDFQ